MTADYFVLGAKVPVPVSTARVLCSVDVQEFPWPKWWLDVELQVVMQL